MEAMQESIGVFGQNVFIWTYGKRMDKRLELFPLSMADQLKLSKLIVGVFHQVAEVQAGKGIAGDVQFISAAMDLIGQNIEKVVALVADLPEDDERICEISSHLTNDQLMGFVQYVWETNFGAVRKNYKSLFSELGTLTKGQTNQV